MLLGRKADSGDVLIMALESCQAPDALLERLVSIERPKFDRVVFRAAEENSSLFGLIRAHNIEAEHDVRVPLVELNLPAFHIEKLQCFAIRA